MLFNDNEHLLETVDAFAITSTQLECRATNETAVHWVELTSTFVDHQVNTSRVKIAATNYEPAYFVQDEWPVAELQEEGNRDEVTVLGFAPRGYYNYEPVIELTVHTGAKEQVTCRYGKQKVDSQD